MDELPPLPSDIVDTLNNMRGGFDRLIGLTFVAVSYAELKAELPMHEGLTQPYGLVHGGVYAAAIETVTSAGSAMHALAAGRSCVGLENSTSFLRGAHEGTLTITARPLTQGRKTSVWSAEVHDCDARLVATGRVRHLLLEGRPGA
mgnify:CR=1 FL=1